MKLPITSATMNPLWFMKKDAENTLDRCDGLAQALVVRTGEERDNHWLDATEFHISAVAGAVVQYAPPAQRSLQEVADILANPQKLAMCTEMMIKSPAWGGLLARRGGQLLHYVDKEKGSVLTTCGQTLRFLNTPAMVRSTSTSSFEPANLKRRRMTIYCVLPAEHMSKSGWMRMVLTALLDAVISEGLDESRLVHFILDEAGRLGPLDALKQLLEFYRGYGCRGHFFYQSAGALKECWPKDQGQVLWSNTAKIFFGTADYETASLISKMAGHRTIVVESGGSSNSGGGNWGWSATDGKNTESGGGNRGWSRSENWQQAPRELLKPEEILTLDPRIAITFPGGGVRPVLTYLMRYFEEPSLGKPSTWEAVKMLCRSFVLLVSAYLTAAMLAQMVMSQERGSDDGQGNRPGIVWPGNAGAVNGGNGSPR